MVCQKCNTQLEKNEQFCSQCGTPQTEVIVGDNNSSTGQVHINTQQDSDSKESPMAKKIKYTILIIIGLAFFGYQIFATLENTAVDKGGEALALYDSGDTQSAIEIQEQVVEEMNLPSNKVISLISLAYMYLESGQTNKAREAFNRALDITEEGAADRYLILGEVAYLDEKWPDAEGYFLQAAEVDPKNFQAHNSLMLLYTDLDDIHPELYDATKAIKHGELALDYVDPDFQNSVRQGLAIAYLYNGEPDTTIEMMSQSDINREPHVAFWIGLAYLEKGGMEGIKGGYVEKAQEYFDIAKSGGFEVPDHIIDGYR